MSKYDDEQRERTEQNFRKCKAISDELDAYVDGYVYRDEDGDVHDISDEMDDLDDVPEDWEQLSVYDWAEDVLDVSYLIGFDGQYRAVKYVVATGGPHIVCDTESGYVELYWWGETARYELSHRAADALDEMASEMYESMR